MLLHLWDSSRGSSGTKSMSVWGGEAERGDRAVMFCWHLKAARSTSGLSEWGKTLKMFPHCGADPSSGATPSQRRGWGHPPRNGDAKRSLISHNFIVYKALLFMRDKCSTRLQRRVKITWASESMNKDIAENTCHRGKVAQSPQKIYGMSLAHRVLLHK